MTVNALYDLEKDCKILKSLQFSTVSTVSVLRYFALHKALLKVSVVSSCLFWRGVRLIDRISIVTVK